MSGKEPEHCAGQPTMIRFLNETPFDELVEIDLVNSRCRNLRHTEGKFLVPVMDTSVSAMSQFAPENMVHPEDRARLTDFMDAETIQDRLKRSGGLLQTELRYKTVDGGWRWTRQLLISGQGFGLPDGIVRAYLYDIQEEKERTHTEFQGRMNTRDALTGLLTDRDIFTLAQEKLRQVQGEWCVIAIDIEYFRLFADWKGKAEADRLLAEIGGALRQVELDTGGLAGYRGTDDFWLFVPFDLRLIYSLYEQLKKLIMNHGSTVGFMPIFGICQAKGPSDEATDLFNHAAMTAEQVKGDYQNRIKVYNPSAALQTAEEYRMLTDFQKGLDSGEVFFCLQPQCIVSSGKVVGAEALARWQLKDGGMVPPAKFVPLLEKYGMVTNLDQYMWEAVCRWQRTWLDKGHTPVPISVNISQIDMQNIDVPAYFEGLLKKYRLPAYLIKAEITESAYVGSTSVARDTVRRLRNMGLLVLMDDFGSGYSSLNMLHSLNVDVIKLDAQFLRINSKEERKGISILETVVNMAKTIAIPIVVEGVETQEQSNFLADLGCRYMQGYYFYRPMRVEEFESLIQDKSRIDLRGFEVKANVQIHPREFLDENLFSDAMLNNILGPVAIYQWDGAERVDIVRYNQQFYEMVGISLQQFNLRRLDISKFIFPEDRSKLIHIMEAAERDHLNGARGVVRVYKPNGVLVWIFLQLYYMNSTGEGKTFYGASRDVTEQQYINVDLPGGYHRVSADTEMEFKYISQNFLEMTGYTEREIQEEFDGKLINMVHPDDRESLLRRLTAVMNGQSAGEDPFRLKCRRGGYLYVALQQILTDMYGEMCLMCMITDVTEMIKVHECLDLLAGAAADSLFLVTRDAEGTRFQVRNYTLEEKLGMSQEEFQHALELGMVYGWFEEAERQRIYGMMMEITADGDIIDTETNLLLPNGQRLRAHIRFSRISANSARKKYICVILAL